ncbi:MAG: sodium:proton antiporter [Bacteroidia bacterium]|nr:sodium:proton antiporter [Bacteroidia bacterium]
MSTAIIISICILLLLAYLFDLTSPYTRIPAVILLLLSGWLGKQLSLVMDIHLPDLTGFLPLLGTVGLILIVLEGSLELELNKSKRNLIAKSIGISLLPLIACALTLAWIFSYFSGLPLHVCLVNAIPLCIISSAIAISSARNLPQTQREFVVYESSLSDIFGVLLFNFFSLNDTIDAHSIMHFSWELLLIVLISFLSTVLLSFLLHKIDHHIKFVPIILMVILIYEISKEYHLPSLIFILLFGLFLGNLDEFKKNKWIRMLKARQIEREVEKFREITTEVTFLIRSLFFLLFGYLIETDEIFNPVTFVWAVAIVAGIFLIRAFFLAIFRMKLHPLLFIAPRGLITILLFFAIDPRQQLQFVNKSLVLQVIILTAFIMMLGMMFSRKEQESLADTTIPGGH